MTCAYRQSYLPRYIIIHLMLIVLIDILRLVQIASDRIAHEEQERNDQKSQHHVHCSLA